MPTKNNIKNNITISPLKNMQSLKKIIKALSAWYSSDHMMFDYGNTYTEFLNILFISLIMNRLFFKNVSNFCLEPLMFQALV